jgi:TolB-like protein
VTCLRADARSDCYAPIAVIGRLRGTGNVVRPPAFPCGSLHGLARVSVSAERLAERMSHVFISYARSTAREAQAVAAGLRGLGHEVWLDDEIPAHRAYADVIEERLKAAKAVVVVWSVEAAKSEWVRSEADRARSDRKLVQLKVDDAALPMPFDQIQCADMSGWTGDLDAPGWKKVVASIKELLQGSERPSSAVQDAADEGPPLPSKPSIAVMPFANLSGDPEQEYFADGMVEEVTAALSRFRSIFVVGSGSTLSFKGRAPPTAEVGRRLGVRYLLEGSVRKAGARVRIALRLTEAADGAQLWANRFDDTLEDVFALQDRVAVAVAGVIEPAVRSAEIDRVARKPAANLSSYDLYLRSLPLIWPPDRARIAQARELLERSVGEDATFAIALAQLSHCYGTLVVFHWAGEEEPAVRQRGLEMARRAVREAPEDPSVLTWAGNALMLLGPDWREGGLFIQRAVMLNPGDAAARFIHGRLELMRGELERSVDDLEAAQRLDPLSERIQAGTGMLTGVARFYQGRFAEAVELLEAAEAEIASPAASSYLAAALGQMGDLESAANALARAMGKLDLALPQPMAGGRPEHRKLFEDGIRIASGRAPLSG